MTSENKEVRGIAASIRDFGREIERWNHLRRPLSIGAMYRTPLGTACDAHPATPAAGRCAACDVRTCAACLVYVEMRPLCAKCGRRELRRRSLLRHLRWSGLAILALSLWAAGMRHLRPPSFVDPPSWGTHGERIHALRAALYFDDCSERVLLQLSREYETVDSDDAVTVLANALGRCALSEGVDERLWSLHTRRNDWAQAADDATRLLGRLTTVARILRRAHARMAAREPGLAAQDFRWALSVGPNGHQARICLDGLAEYWNLMRDPEYVATLSESARRSHP